MRFSKQYQTVIDDFFKERVLTRKSYPPNPDQRVFEELNPDEKERIVDIRSPSDIHSFVFTTYWEDAHELCLGTKINNVPFGLWWVAPMKNKDAFYRKIASIPETSLNLTQQALIYGLLDGQYDRFDIRPEIRELRKVIDVQRQNVKTHGVDISQIEESVYDKPEYAHLTPEERAIFPKIDRAIYNAIKDWDKDAQILFKPSIESYKTSRSLYDDLYRNFEEIYGAHGEEIRGSRYYDKHQQIKEYIENEIINHLRPDDVKQIKNIEQVTDQLTDAIKEFSRGAWDIDFAIQEAEAIKKAQQQYTQTHGVDLSNI